MGLHERLKQKDGGRLLLGSLTEEQLPSFLNILLDEGLRVVFGSQIYGPFPVSNDIPRNNRGGSALLGFVSKSDPNRPLYNIEVVLREDTMQYLLKIEEAFRKFSPGYDIGFC